MTAEAIKAETRQTQSGDTEIDIEGLLAPIDGDDPCGKPFTETEAFAKIEEARREDNADLPQGIWQTDLKQADWIGVDALCQQVLAQETKDLHCAVWLTEAWMQLHGLAGFRRGLDLICCLCEEFWEGVHPRIEDGDADFRVAPLAWAARRFPVLLRLSPITEPVGGEGKPLSIVQWQEVLRLENLAKRDPDGARRAGRGKPDRNAFEASVSLTTLAFHEALGEEVTSALSELDRFDRYMDEVLPSDGPSFAEIRSVLEEIDDRLRLYIQSKGGRLPGAEEDESEDLAANATAAAQEEGEHDMPEVEAGGQISSGPIKGRAEAYQRLSEVADYLIRTEPHSPVPYLIRRAVAWGDMSFGELLVQLVEGGGDHTRVLRLLGLNEMGKPEKKD